MVCKVWGFVAVREVVIVVVADGVMVALLLWWRWGSGKTMVT
jgi:hypothetical protein